MDIRPIDGNALKEDFCSMPPFEIDRHDVLEMIGDQEILSLNTLRDAIYEDAVAHGLWEEVDQYAERRAAESGISDKEKERLYFRTEAATELVLDEAEEMLVEVGREHYEDAVEELADVVIQAFSTAGYLGIDIDAAIRRKMEINKGRPWKHGKE